jgi:hypothetical protein
MKSFLAKCLFVGLIATGCVVYGEKLLNQTSPPIPCSGNSCISESTQRTVYIGMAINNEDELKFDQNFIDAIAKKIGDSKIVFDTLEGNDIRNQFSPNMSSRRSLLELSTKLKVTSSSDKAIVLAFNRMLEIGEKNGQRPLYAYILTSGTSDPATLAEIHAISVAFAKKKVPNVHFHIVGLSPTHRLEMSKAIAPLDDCMKFSSASDGEWVQLLQPLSN